MRVQWHSFSPQTDLLGNDLITRNILDLKLHYQATGCTTARNLQIFDIDNDGKVEIFITSQNVCVILLYTQGASKTDWTLQNGCNGRDALGAINNRFLLTHLMRT